MTIPEIIAVLKELQFSGFLSVSYNEEAIEKIAIHLQSTLNKDHWTDKFFPPSTPEK